jgi:hypothetical protein
MRGQPCEETFFDANLRPRLQLSQRNRIIRDSSSSGTVPGSAVRCKTSPCWVDCGVLPAADQDFPKGSCAHHGCWAPPLGRRPSGNGAPSLPSLERHGRVQSRTPILGPVEPSWHWVPPRIVNPSIQPNIFCSCVGMSTGISILTRQEGQKFGFPLFQGR